MTGRRLIIRCIRDKENTTRRQSMRGLGPIELVIILALLGILAVVIVPDILTWLGY